MKCGCKSLNPPLVCTVFCGCPDFCENVDPQNVKGIKDDCENEENNN